MAGSITITADNVPGGSDKQVQYNDNGVLAGAAQLFWDKANDRLGIGDSTPAQQLSITKCMEMLVCSGSGVGVLYKGANRFMHDYKAPSADGFNIFLGEDAGNFSMAPGGSSWYASYNVGIGYNALNALTIGYSNMAIGYNALSALTSGIHNSGVGVETLCRNATGSHNVAIGSRAGLGIASQSIAKNVLIGYKAGYALGTNGNGNICIGYQAGDNITTGATNIIIGYNLNALVAAGDNQLNIGSLIFGDLGATKKVGVNTSTLNETLNVGGAIRLGTSALTNAGTIRWTGADFEGYTGAAWASLTSAVGLWTDAGTYYRPNNVTNSGNTGVRIYDAGYTGLGQVSPTTGNNFGGGSCTDGTVLRVNHGNVGSPTADGKVPLWVKRYTNKNGTDWGCGAAYFGSVKTAGTNPIHTVVIDNYCSGGSVPQAHGVLGCLLSHLKNDAVTGVQEDIHNMQLITYTPSNDYNSVHDCVAIDLLNRYGSKGWKDFYANGWTCGLSVSNESASAYHNSCGFALCRAGTAGKWYIGIDLGEIAYDAGVAKGEAIRFRTGTYDANAVCMRADGALSLRAGGETIVYQTNSIKFKTGTPAAPTTRMEFTATGNIIFNNNAQITFKDSGAVNRTGFALDTNNDWWTMSNGRYACIGADCSQSNPVLIRINGSNNQQLLRSADTDGAGRHYVTVA
jgi:hypothetical protein